MADYKSRATLKVKIMRFRHLHPQIVQTRTIRFTNKIKEMESSIRLYYELWEDCFWICLKETIDSLSENRFANVKSSEFFEALWNLINKNILSRLKSELKSTKNVLTNSKYAFNLSELNEHQIDWAGLTIFMFRFIGFKPKDHVKYNKVIEAKGDLIQTWMYNYSQPKLKKLSKLIEFKILYQFAYFNHLDSMFETDSLLSSNRDEHLTAFKRINNVIMNGSK